MYHQECTHGPGFVPQTFQTLPPQHYTTPMSDERVRQIVRQELALHGVRLTPVGGGDGNTFAVG